MQIKMTFPCRIQQVDENTVNILTKPYDGPILVDGVIDVMAPDLSTAEKDRLIDDVATFLITEGIRRSLVLTATVGPREVRIQSNGERIEKY